MRLVDKRLFDPPHVVGVLPVVVPVAEIDLDQPTPSTTPTPLKTYKMTTKMLKK